MNSTQPVTSATLNADDSNSDQIDRESLPAWAFVIAAAALFLILVIAHLTWIVQVTYGAAAKDSQGVGWNWIWSLLCLAFLVLACLNQYWGLRSLRSEGLQPAAIYFGLMLCSGLAALGIQMLAIACFLAEKPLVFDFSGLEAVSRPSSLTSGVPASVPGDPAEGQKLFAMTCVTCHGPTGDGLNNLAPSLRSSDFIKSASTGDISRVVKLGRAVNDPANKSGKVMPARGGNPFLTDQQVAHLVSFIKGLPNGPAAVNTMPSESGPPAPTLNRWVVPAAALPPSGLVALNSKKDLLGSAAFERVVHSRRTTLVRALGLAAMFVHGFFLAALFLCGTEILFGWLLGVRKVITTTWLRVVSVGWLIALFVWIGLGCMFLLV